VFEGWFVYVAVTENRSTVIEARPYEAGLEYGKVVEAMRAAKSGGVSLDLELTGEGVRGSMQGLDPALGWRVKMTLLRLNDPAADQRREFKVSTSRFFTALDPLKPGLYLVRTWIERENIRYFFESGVHR